MFRFMILVAGLAGMIGSSAAAKVHELRYDFDLEITYLSHYGCSLCGYPDPYDGPLLGDVGRGSVNVSFDDRRPYDADVSADLLGVRVVDFLNRYARLFEPTSKRIDVSASDLDLLDVELDPNSGTGSGVFGREYDTADSWMYLEFTASKVTVTDLAPVPVPPALPMLGAAGAALFALRHRRRAA